MRSHVCRSGGCTLQHAGVPRSQRIFSCTQRRVFAHSNVSSTRGEAAHEASTTAHASSEVASTSQSRTESAGTSATPYGNPSLTWQRLHLVKRQIAVAVKEEQYSLAAKLKKEAEALQTALPPLLQYLAAQADKLRVGSTDEQLKAINQLGEAGDDVVVPELASVLGQAPLAEAATQALWSIFMRSKIPEVNVLMLDGLRAMANPITFDQALSIFTKMIDIQPDFAEAYNKRATVLYLMDDHEGSISDCRRVLALQPYHFGAASGMGLCYLKLSQPQAALAAFEEALRINPAMTSIHKFVRELKDKQIASEGPYRGNDDVKP